MKPEATHRTVEGHYLAGIYSTDNGGKRPIHGWVEYANEDRQAIQLTNDFKLSFDDKIPFIEPIPKKVHFEFWVNLYENGVIGSQTYQTEEVAKQNAGGYAHRTVKFTHEIEF